MEKDYRRVLEVQAQAVYKHFKGDLYFVEAVSYPSEDIMAREVYKEFLHTETGEKIAIFKNTNIVGTRLIHDSNICKDELVLYIGITGEGKIGMLYARPIKMFCSKVDKEKYPNTNQVYRFEEVKSECKYRIIVDKDTYDVVGMKYAIKNYCKRNYFDYTDNYGCKWGESCTDKCIPYRSICSKVKGLLKDNDIDIMANIHSDIIKEVAKEIEKSEQTDEIFLPPESMRDLRWKLENACLMKIHNNVCSNVENICKGCPAKDTCCDIWWEEDEDKLIKMAKAFNIPVEEEK